MGGWLRSGLEFCHLWIEGEIRATSQVIVHISDLLVEKMLCNLCSSMGQDPPPWKYDYYLMEAQRRELMSAPPRKGNGGPEGP